MKNETGDIGEKGKRKQMKKKTGKQKTGRSRKTRV